MQISQSDADRFSLGQQKDETWHARASAAARLLDLVRPGEHIRIADIGCGDCKLRDHIGRSELSYQGFDLLPQSDEVEALDISAEAPAQRFDAAVLLGVLEYMTDIPAVLRRLMAAAPHLVLSYQFPHGGASSPNWRNRKTLGEIEADIEAAGLHVIARESESDGQTRLWLASI